MPFAAPKPCTLCGVLVRDGTSRCEKHPARRGFLDPKRGNRHQRGYGADWDHRRLRILERDAGLCCPCRAIGRLTLGREVDHKVPKARGGTDDDENLQTICRPCHKSKTGAEAHGRTWTGPAA
jgi:5-methylcytosine-specific restriction enzyme A